MVREDITRRHGGTEVRRGMVRSAYRARLHLLSSGGEPRSLTSAEDTSVFFVPLCLCVSLFGVLFLFSCNEPERTPETWNTATPLKEIYQDDFLMGNIIRDNGDFSNANRSGILKRHYNVVTAENHMKPSYLAPGSKGGAYQFGTADTMVNNAINAGFKVHGHTLIWHEQGRDWLTTGTQEEVLENLEQFVTDVVTHYKGKVISWDVVNEAFADGANNTDWKECLRNSPWNTAGKDYIEKAFLAAREADPDVKLFYNDYGLNGEGKRMATYNMVKDINERNPNVKGRPLIDGIGMQTHHHLNTNPDSVRASIEKFAELGVEIAISEMDIIAANWPSLSLGAWNEEAAQKQAAQYAAMFRIFKDNAQYISRVTFWGLDDGTSWRGSSRVTLMNADFTLKPAFLAVMNPYGY